MDFMTKKTATTKVSKKMTKKTTTTKDTGMNKKKKKQRLCSQIITMETMMG